MKQKKVKSQLSFKIIVIGQSGTGKSCLMSRYIKDDFSSEYSVTVGVQFASKIVKIDQTYSIKLQIWDTAGQESFRSIVRNFYRNSSAVFLVYNIMKKNSFLDLASWLKQARQNTPKNVMYVLVGTHLDCIQNNVERQVSRQQAEKWMVQQHLDLFFETSAKTNINVNKAFDETGNQLFLHYIKNRTNSMVKSQQLDPSQKKSNKLLNPQTKHEKKCCNI